MAITTIDDKHLTNIATAIRQKSGVEDTFKPSEMASAIKNISGGEPILEDLEVSPTTSEQVITAHQGYDGINQITIAPVTNLIDDDIRPENIKKDVEILGVIGTIEDKPAEPVLQNKIVEPSTGKQIITADSGYDGLGQVTLNEVTSSIDSNIRADNIKQGVSILGVEGNLDAGQVIVQKYKPQSISFSASTATDLQSETRLLDTSLLTTMKNMFSSCSKLVLIDLSEWDTSNVTIMTNMFSYCEKLSSIGDINHFNISKVTDTNSMFYNCKLLSELNLSNWEGTNIIECGGMFSGCSNIQKIDLSNFNASKVIYATNLFYNCSRLREVNLQNFAPVGAKDIGGMFSGCSSLQKIDIRSLELSKIGGRTQTIKGVPTNCLIIVKNDTERNIIKQYGGYTNVKTLAEYQAEGGV